MPLLFPAPFPSETASNRTEQFRFGRNTWLQLQKFRGASFSFPGTTFAPGSTRVTFTDTSVGGSSIGFDNLTVGMWVSVSLPASIDPGLAIEQAFVSAPGTMVVQVRNTTGAPIVQAAASWAYIAFKV